jgi:hypothetical protein
MFIFLSFLDSKSNLCRQFVFYEKNAIPHPAIPDCTNSLFGVEVIEARKSSRSKNFWILPDAVWGNWATKRQIRGAL